MTLAATILLTLVAYLPMATSATTVGRWAVLALCASFMLVRMRTLPIFGRSHAWGLALLCWMALGLMWSVSPLDTTGSLIHWIVLAVVFTWATQEKHDQNLALAALVLGLIPSLIVAVAEISGHVLVDAEASPAGLLLNRNSLGEIAAVALIWSVAARRYALALVPLALVLLSGSRGAALACACGGLYWLWAGGQRRRAALATLGFAVCVIAYVVLTRNVESWLIRAEIWLFAVANFTFLGSGLDTFATFAPGFGYVHNDYVQFVFELGIGAALAIPILWRAFSGARSPESAALAALLGAALVSYPTQYPVGAMLLVVLAGLRCGAADRARVSESLLRRCGATRALYERHGTADEIRAARSGIAHVAA